MSVPNCFERARLETLTPASSSKRFLFVAVAFFLVLLALLAVAQSFGVTEKLGGHRVSSIVSFALVFAPYWFFGFGLGDPLSGMLNQPWKRIAASITLLLPWLVFVLPRHAFRWDIGAGLLFIVLAVTCVLEHGRRADGIYVSDWHDVAALLLLAFAVELPLFRDAWPIPGLAGVSKLLFVDAGLFGYLVVRPVGGIGFVLQITLADLSLGVREFFFYTPLALAIGFVLHFLHWHPVGFVPLQFAAAWLFTLFFIAIPEEIFFRGLLLNLLERRWGTNCALIASALLFGLAHFPKRAAFNWRYVILAALAGIFYGRAWLARRRVLTSAVTHATVDSVWSIWFR